MKLTTILLALMLMTMACKSDGDSKTSEQPAADPGPTATPSPAPAALNPGANERVGGKVACGLMTKEEASTLVGVPLGEGEANELNCTWSEGMKIVILEVRDASQFAIARKMAKEMDADGFEELSGVGDEAFYGAVAGHHVVFRVGDRYAQLGVIGAGSEGKQAVIDFAKALTPRLK